MFKLKKNKFYEVSITIEGRCVLLQGVTKWTTCSDVIKMVLKKFYGKKDNQNTTSFGMYVSSRDEEKQLPVKSKLLKVMRSWNPHNDCKFVMKMVSAVTRPKISEARRRKLSLKYCSNDNSTSSRYDSQCHMSGMLDGGNSNTGKTYKSSQQRMPVETYVNLPQSPIPDRFQIGSSNYSSRRQRSCEYCDSLKHTRQNYEPLCYATDSRNVTGQSQNYTQFIDSYDSEMLLQGEVKYAKRKILRHTSAGKSRDSLFEHVDVSSQEVRDRQSTPVTVEKRSEDRFYHTLNEHVKLAQNIKYQIANESQKEGKEAILNKYFADYLMYQSPRQPSTCRGQGDGAEYNYDDDIFRRGDGSSFTNYCFSNSVDQHGPSFPKDTSIDGDTASDSGQEDGEFDIAFIDNVLHDEADCVTKLVDYSLTESDISDIVGDPVYNTTNTSCVSDFVKSVFNDAIVGDEDDEIESFMNTILSDDVIDEGLSSLGSDIEI